MPFNLFISSLYILYFIILCLLDNDVLETSKRRAMFYNILLQILLLSNVLQNLSCFEADFGLKKTKKQKKQQQQQTKQTNKFKHFSRFKFFLVCYCPNYSKDRSEAGKIFRLSNKLTIETMDTMEVSIFCHSHKYLPDHTYLFDSIYLFSK